MMNKLAEVTHYVGPGSAMYRTHIYECERDGVKLELILTGLCLPQTGWKPHKTLLS